MEIAMHGISIPVCRYFPVHRKLCILTTPPPRFVYRPAEKVNYLFVTGPSHVCKHVHFVEMNVDSKNLQAQHRFLTKTKTSVVKKQHLKKPTV
uniref:Uncharacterized protein n=1 Tax=Romanomermis culicivorax TaxID=13658 RepID=A0A915K9C9_ROMCU